MRIECSHLLASGEKCQAPAVTGSSLCRHHHPRKHAKTTDPFSLPPFSDHSSLLVAISEVLQAITERRITRSEAGTLLFGLQMASRVMSGIDREIDKARASGEYGDYGEPLETDSNSGRESHAGHNTAMEEVEALLGDMPSPSTKSSHDRRDANHPAPLQKLPLKSHAFVTRY